MPMPPHLLREELVGNSEKPKYVLLTGAGFSSNWGLWLGKEIWQAIIGSKKLKGNKEAKSILLDHKNIERYEEALAYAEKDYPSTYKLLTEVILDVFTFMDEFLLRSDRKSIPESKNEHDENKVIKKYFLARFDYIFTLNQDLLFERVLSKYLYHNTKRPNFDICIPGIEPIEFGKKPLSEIRRSPKKDIQVQLESHQVPYIKLHGSCDWNDENGNIIIMGANKREQKEKFPILKEYDKQFEEALEKNTRLMIIGYSFNDDDINEKILKGIDKGLQIYIWDTIGLGNLRPEYKAELGVIKDKSKIDLFKRLPDTLRGLYTRNLRETFIDTNSLGFKNIQKFFDE